MTLEEVETLAMQARLAICDLTDEAKKQGLDLSDDFTYATVYLDKIRLKLRRKLKGYEV